MGRRPGRIRRADAIGEMPRAELIGAARVGRQPQLELQLRLVRLVQKIDRQNQGNGPASRRSI
jgi:hypothetical protein